MEKLLHSETPDANSKNTQLDELKARLSKARISFEERIGQSDVPDLIQAEFPNGNNTKQIFIYESRITDFCGIDFEKYVFLGDYEAICSYKDNTIEAAVRGFSIPTKFLIQRILERADTSQLPADDNDEDGDESGSSNDALRINDDNTGCRLEISPTSWDFKTLVSRTVSQGYTLKIYGVELDRHDVALALLEKVANALFFEIDILHNLTLNLIKQRPKFYPGGHRRKNYSTALAFPSYELDSAPISLYWYSRSARGMPLLQFLALYQVIEYYFPTYSQKEAGRRIRSVVKDPAFRPERDSDIGRLLSVIRSSRGGAIGSEREQLRATLYECVDSTELREYLVENDRRKEFFSKRHKELTEQKILTDSTHGDLREATANAIYDIRCKIVHTKAEEGDKEGFRLLPFSNEAELLTEYIYLMQYLAQRVLIAASTPLAISR